MDMRQFTVPRIESPPPRGTATDFINAINAQMVWMEHHKKPHEVIRIFCGGAFGVFRAVRISPEGADFVRLVVRSEDGQSHTIVAPLSQSSVMLSVVVPSTEEPEEKVILGFAEHDKT
jgi:hypothetical protein